MTTEKEFYKVITDIILRVLEENNVKLKKDYICKDGHFSPKMLTDEKLLSMRSDTQFRFLLYIARALPEENIRRIFDNLLCYILFIANKNDGSFEAIIDSHAGSPIKTKK